jgi:hypothetical protein
MATLLTVSPPNLEVARFHIRGTAPLVQHKFAEKSRREMLAKQTAKTKAKPAREPRDIDAEYLAALHRNDTDQWHGHPCAAFRSALISACRVAGIVMTRAKLSVFVLQDGLGVDGTPLVKLSGTPELFESAVRLESGVASIAIRPMWREWDAHLTLKFDADQLALTDVANLLLRAGAQVGVGEGRPDSKKSTGQGWGTFEIDGGIT